MLQNKNFKSATLRKNLFYHFSLKSINVLINIEKILACLFVEIIIFQNLKTQIKNKQSLKILIYLISKPCHCQIR